MRRNLAQSLFQYGQIETTLIKAKEVRPFVERLITLARKGTLQSRQRVIAMLNDRAIIDREEQEQYEGMSRAQRHRVLMGRSGRRHRTGAVPASYDKKKYPFVAESVVHKLISEVAPMYRDRPGGYTRIIRLAKRRIGDNADLALLQLVGVEEKPAETGRKNTISRRRKSADRIRYLEGKGPKKKARHSGRKPVGSAPDGSGTGQQAKPSPDKDESKAPGTDAE